MLFLSVPVEFIEVAFKLVNSNFVFILLNKAKIGTKKLLAMQKGHWLNEQPGGYILSFNLFVHQNLTEKCHVLSQRMSIV